MPQPSGMPLSLATRLGRTIREQREATGISQERFAANIGRHRTFMGSLERGETNPSLDTLERVAKALGTPLSHLLRLAEERTGDDRVYVPHGPLRRVAEPRKKAKKRR